MRGIQQESENRGFVLSRFCSQASGKTVVSGVVPSPPPVRAFRFYRAQGSAFPLLVDFHRMYLTHALPHSANQFVHKKPSLLVYTSIHSGGLELTQFHLYIYISGTRITCYTTEAIHISGKDS